MVTRLTANIRQLPPLTKYGTNFHCFILPLLVNVSCAILIAKSDFKVKCGGKIVGHPLQYNIIGETHKYVSESYIQIKCSQHKALTKKNICYTCKIRLTRKLCINL